MLSKKGTLEQKSFQLVLDWVNRWYSDYSIIFIIGKKKIKDGNMQLHDV